MYRSIANKQRKRLLADILMGAAVALGLSLSIVSIDAAASAATHAVETVAPSDCDLPYADQVAKRAAGEMPDDIVCS